MRILCLTATVQAQPSKKLITTEVAVVLALSLGASTVYSVISFIAKTLSSGGLGSQTTALNKSLAAVEWLNVTLQFAGSVLGLAPVALVLLLIWRDGRNPFQVLGISSDNFLKRFVEGLGLSAAIAIPGLFLYLASRALGLTSKVVPAELAQYWWTVPLLLLAAIKAAALEETIAVGYLFERLRQLGIRPTHRIWISAALRGSYHLYQGLGGFIGNLAMGLVFGYLYQRFGRLTPLLIAHFVIDATIFVGFALMGNTLKLP